MTKVEVEESTFPFRFRGAGFGLFTEIIRMTWSRWRSVFRFWIELRCGWFLFLYFLFYCFLSTSQPLFCYTNIEQLSSIDFFGWTIGSEWFDPIVVWSIPWFDNLKEIWFMSDLEFYSDLPDGLGLKLNYQVEYRSLYLQLLFCF